MKILAIETTGRNGSAAVCNDGRINLVISEGEMSHLRDIINISDAAMRNAGVDKSELTHIAASIGPGSFTGIRIGVTTARTMAQFLTLPCVAVSSLEAMMRNVLEPAADNDCRIIVSIINARRKQTYAGAWHISGNGNTNEICEQRQYMIDELIDILRQKYPEGGYYFVGDGIDAYEDIIAEMLEPGQYKLADEALRYQTADSVAQIAAEKALKGEVLTYEELLPDYMRLSEAEQRLRDGTLSSKIRKQN